jgi:hypothetical protein
MALYPIVRARLQSKDFREDSLMRYLALTHPTRSAIALTAIRDAAYRAGSA